MEVVVPSSTTYRLGLDDFVQNDVIILGLGADDGRRFGFVVSFAFVLR